MISSEKVNINEFLTIVALEDETTIELALYNGENGFYSPKCSINGEKWFEYTTKISINQGDTLSIRAYNYVIGKSSPLSISKKFNAIGKTESIGDMCNYLFSGQDIVDASLLKVSNNCHHMFDGCTSLTTAPELPATTLPNGCYKYMFHGCTSLTTAPELPATTLADHCYNNMFSGCTNLTTAPELPATTLASSCYGGMFLGCTSLVSIPELPATTLANYCYNGMFSGCTSLATAPSILPATSLTHQCYGSMFSGCSSLTAAPALPATTLASICYVSMFRGCTKLNYIKMLATDISAEGCLRSWVDGVASTGTFVKNPTMTSLPTGSSGIPSGWTVVDDGEESGG